MEILFKIILSTVAVLIFLLITAVCALPFAIDPNDFKPQISIAVKNMTGRELVLDGALKLSLFPWLGVSTGKIALSNATGFQDQPFASLEESEVQVLLLPLLSKRLEICHVVLKGLVLNLAKNKQSNVNWDDLTQTRETKPLAPNAPVVGKQDQQVARPAIAIGGIAIEDARINWDDLESGQHFELKDLNLNADKLAFDESIGIAVSLSAPDPKSTTVHSIKLHAELNVNQRLDIFVLHDCDLQITTAGDTIPGKSLTTASTIANIALDMSQQTAKINGLQLRTGDVQLSAQLTGTSIKDKPLFQGPVSIAQFSPANAMQHLTLALPVMQDATALSKLAGNFYLAAAADSVELQKLVLSLDESQIQGSVGIYFSQAQNNVVPPTIRFLLATDDLAVDRYLPPTEQSAKLITSPALLLAAGFSAIPVEILRNLDAEGTVTLGKLKVHSLTMQDTHLALSTKKGIVTIKQSIKQFYQGSYLGDLRMDANGDKPTLVVNEKIDHLQLEPLLMDLKGTAKLSGIVNATAQLQAQGRKADELKATLNGQLSFFIKDAVIKDFNLKKIITYKDLGKALIKGSALPTEPKHDQTLFSEMSGTATITKGLIQNNDLFAKSSELHVDGKGNLNLVSEALVYKIDAKLLNGDVTAAEPEQIKGAVAINIAGTLDQPTYTLDIASLLTDQNKAKIEQLINKLDKKLGSGVGDLLKNLLK